MEDTSNTKPVDIGDDTNDSDDEIILEFLVVF